MAPQAPADKLGRPGISNRGRAQAIVAENGLVAGIVDGKKGLRAAHLVALAGITLQKFVQRRFAAVEGLPIMPFADGLLVPGLAVHLRFGSDFAAASSFGLGLSGSSSR